MVKLKRRKPRSGKKGYKRTKGWCTCDRNIVANGATCGECRRKIPKGKIERMSKDDIKKELDKNEDKF